MKINLFFFELNNKKLHFQSFFHKNQVKMKPKIKDIVILTNYLEIVQKTKNKFKIF